MAFRKPKAASSGAGRVRSQWRPLPLLALLVTLTLAFSHNALSIDPTAGEDIANPFLTHNARRSSRPAYDLNSVDR